MKQLRDLIDSLEKNSSSRFQSLRRVLRLNYWFPQVPLALAIFALGIVHAINVPITDIGWGTFAEDIRVAADQLITLDMHRLPQLIPAFFLIAMSIGILLRSQFAWIITLLFLSVSVVLDVYSIRISGAIGFLIFDAITIGLLVYFRRYFQKRSLASTTLFGATSLLVVLGYAVIGTLRMGDQFRPPIDSFVKSLFFTIETMSTVGYGNIIPVTREAEYFAISVIVLGITVFATVISTIVLPIFNDRIRSILKRGNGPMERFNHFVIVGDSPLARNTYKNFKAKGQEVTVILPQTTDNSVYSAGDILVGDGSDLDILKQANADKAIAVLALGDDDAENAFVVLASKEVQGKPKTVAGVGDSRNLKRLHWVKPDLVIAPPVLGGEILAMTLTGERIDDHAILDSLFYKLEK